MELTNEEMKLNNLEYSVTYCGVMVGEIVLFKLNSNIDNAQSEILYKEIIRRINAFEKDGLVDGLVIALEKYGDHLGCCHKNLTMGKCNCGLEAAIAKVKA